MSYILILPLLTTVISYTNPLTININGVPVKWNYQNYLGGWSKWSACSITCGHGQRTRTCINPGGNQCVGDKQQYCFIDKHCSSRPWKSCKLTPKDERGPFYVKKKYTLETDCIAFSKNNPSPGSCDDEEYRKEPIRIQGKVLDSICRPIKGAIMEYWQTAPEWSVSHPHVYTMVDSSCTGIEGSAISRYVDTMDPSHVKQCKHIGHVPDCITHMDYKGYRGWQKTDRDGNYQLNTVRPGIYEIRPIRHIHIKITVPGKTIGGLPSLITQLYLPQNEPRESEKDLFKLYDKLCKKLKIKPEQWAKKQDLLQCPVRNDPERANDDPNLTIYNWDVVLDM